MTPATQTAANEPDALLFVRHYFPVSLDESLVGYLPVTNGYYCLGYHAYFDFGSLGVIGCYRSGG